MKEKIELLQQCARDGDKSALKELRRDYCTFPCRSDIICNKKPDVLDISFDDSDGLLEITINDQHTVCLNKEDVEKFIEVVSILRI